MKMKFLFSICMLCITACEGWNIDKCLDSGGRWNYEADKCEYEEGGD